MEPSKSITLTFNLKKFYRLVYSLRFFRWRFQKKFLSADYAEQVLAHTETLGPPMVLEKNRSTRSSFKANARSTVNND